MLYNFVADSFHTEKLCSRLSSSEVRYYTENGNFAFLLHFGGLGVRTMMILGSLDFLLDLIQLFSRISVQNRWFRSNEVSLTKIFR